MSLPAAFLGGARNRLLPASVPFRYFFAAVVFHVLAWIVLLAGAGELPGYAGGPGLVLAALHLLTLGVLTMTAMGAAFQLLPVATRQPLVRVWPARAAFWLFAPGTLLLAWGMASAVPELLMSGGAAVLAGLAIFAVLTADNLRRAASLPVVAWHGRAALAALLGLGVAGGLLLADFTGGFLPDRPAVAAVHMVLAVFGFMGLFAFGFSHVLVPMFALSRSLPRYPGWAGLVLSAGAVILGVAALLLDNALLSWLTLAAGLSGAGLYLWLMHAALKNRMRKRLGLSFVLIRASWGMLAAALLLLAVIWSGVPVPGGAVLFVFLAVAGWLLTFLLGVLQRIMPFLASMHAAGRGGMPPLLSELTAETPLRVHALCHGVALAAIAAGIVLDLPLLVRAGAAAGLGGAVSFAVFAAFVLLKLRRPPDESPESGIR